MSQSTEMTKKRDNLGRRTCLKLNTSKQQSSETQVKEKLLNVA